MTPSHTTLHKATAANRGNIHNGLSGSTLRRRMKFLDRTTTLNSSEGSQANLMELSAQRPNPNSEGKVTERLRPDDVEELSSLEYRSDSSCERDMRDLDTSFEAVEDSLTSRKARDDEDDEPSHSNSNQHHSASINGRHITSSTHSRSVRKKSWYEFDLAVLIAFVSPIGNWLTGGDHVKNVLLVAFLIYYLHQIIEIPWAIYEKARPRHRGLPLPPMPSDSPRDRYALLAATELRRLELFALFLTLISPFLGASLLRYGSEAVLGPEAVSWFSTGLFVLATGMRPWRHLVSRLKARTSELHDFVHYPELCLSDEQKDKEVQREREQENQHRVTDQRIAEVERAVRKVSSELKRSREEMVDRLEDSIEDVAEKQEKQSERVKRFERALQELHARNSAPPPAHRIVTSLCVLKDALVDLVWQASHPAAVPAVQSHRRATITRRRRSASDPVLGALETIVEEDTEPRPMKPTPPLVKRRAPTRSESWLSFAYMKCARPVVALPLRLASALCNKVAFVLTLPLRAVVRLVKE